MRNKFLMTGLTVALCALLPPLAMAAGTANSPPIAISLAVSGTTCSVTNGNPSITMPSANVGQTLLSYQAANLPVFAGPVGAPTWATSTALHQTATITCNAPNTPILGVIVKPGPSALTSATAEQYLVDTATPTPNQAAGTGAFPVYTEQLTINGNPAVFPYVDLATMKPLTYTTSFSTGNLNTAPTPVSTATVGWRPTFYVGNGLQNTFAAPQGGTYNGSFQIQINY